MPDGAKLLSFTMLTINADSHDFMRHYHRPEDEKRMVVVLPPDSYGAWLDAPPAPSMEFMRPCPPELLQAQAEPPVARKRAAPAAITDEQPSLL